MTSSPPITAIHAVFNELTLLNLSLDFYREACWQRWLNKGWTESDLRFVVFFIKLKIKTKERRRESLMFRNLIQDLPRFEEDLSFFRALKRSGPRKRSERESVLEQMGRVKPDMDTVVSAGVALERSELAAKLKAWREKTLL